MTPPVLENWPDVGSVGVMSGPIKLRFNLTCSLLLLAVLSFGCRRTDSSGGPADSGKTPTGTQRVVVQLDWVPEPEHGGLYQAQAKGWFAAAGLDVVLLPGGPNALATQKTATGQVQIAQADSTNTLLAIAEGLPVVPFAAVFQNDPSVLMLHEENPVRDWADLNGRQIMARPEWAFLSYLQRKYGISFKLTPMNYSVANFIADPTLIQQGFYIAEPFHIVQGGGREPRYLFPWESGWDAYVVLIVNRAWAEANGDALRRFTKAYVEGWRDYLQGDPAPAHAAMKAANPTNTDAFLAYSRQKIIEGKLVEGRSGQDRTGTLSPERFARQVEQLRELGILKKDLAPDDVMTSAYLP